MPKKASLSRSAGEVLKVHIPITWSLLLLITVILFTTVFAIWEQARPWVRFLGAATGVAAGVLSAVYIGRALQITIEQRDQALTDDKISRAFEFAHRWNDPNFAPLRAKWRKLLEEVEMQPDDRVWEIVHSDAEKKTIVVDVMNFYEEMAYAARSRVADPETLKKIFGSIVERYFSMMFPWLEKYRKEKHQPTAYEHFPAH